MLWKVLEGRKTWSLPRKLTAEQGQEAREQISAVQGQVKCSRNTGTRPGRPIMSFLHHGQVRQEEGMEKERGKKKEE